jgi:hypothetical protein
MKCSVVEVQRGGAGVRQGPDGAFLSPGWAADWAELGQAERNTPLAAPQHRAFTCATASLPHTDHRSPPSSPHSHPYVLVSCVT